MHAVKLRLWFFFFFCNENCFGFTTRSLRHDCDSEVQNNTATRDENKRGKNRTKEKKGTQPHSCAVFSAEKDFWVRKVSSKKNFFLCSEISSELNLFRTMWSWTRHCHHDSVYGPASGPAVHTGRVSRFAYKFVCKPLMLLATCVNTPIDHNVFHYLQCLLRGALRPVWTGPQVISAQSAESVSLQIYPRALWSKEIFTPIGLL